MTIADLSDDQKVALITLMRFVVMSNAVVTEGEGIQIAAVAETIGDDEYRRLLDVAETRFEDMAALKTFLSGITDQPARDLIFGTVWMESVADPSIQHAESELLNWLSETWNITPE